MNSTKINLWAVFILSITSCAPIPYFHKVTINPHISGTIVYRDSLNPVSGVEVTYGIQKKISDSSGYFEFVPVIQNRYWCLFILGPFDRALAHDFINLHLDSLSTDSAGRFETKVSIRSAPPSRVCLDISRSDQSIIRNELGNIRLYKF